MVGGTVLGQTCHSQHLKTFISEIMTFLKGLENEIARRVYWAKNVLVIQRVAHNGAEKARRPVQAGVD